VKRLWQLLADVPAAELVAGGSDTPVSGVAHDTRRLQPGELFVAVPGFRVNGLELVSEALARGASAIVAEAAPPTPLPAAVPLVRVPSARTALAQLACAFYDHPSRRLSVVGVTGTDGKTSTTQLVSAVLEAAGVRTGWLTTINTKVGDELRPNSADNTTPEAPILQRTLAEMAAAGVEVAIVETSSHALALDRVLGTAFRVGVFTNLAPEHLNFHGSFEAYARAKSRLFAMLPADGLAVLNADDPNSQTMRAATTAPCLNYGLDAPDADPRADQVQLRTDGTAFRLHWQGETHPVRSRLVGRFNVANWLAALGAAQVLGATATDLQRAAASTAPILGRMNLVSAGQPFAVVVDFAHTPQALEKAVQTLRGLMVGRLLLVFGLAGERDAHNRAVMGALSPRSADFVVVSMDDPGEESPPAIAEAIAAGAESAGAVPNRDFLIELDRRAAIRLVLERAQPGDVVLLAGKGHEQRMVVGQERQPWNDARVALEELRRLGLGSKAGPRAVAEAEPLP
jgi:UDP-N-acetylmuramoyl-L-alanyl-D-glutamate--2,6-diaminopimelate ligase